MDRRTFFGALAALPLAATAQPAKTMGRIWIGDCLYDYTNVYVKSRQSGK